MEHLEEELLEHFCCNVLSSATRLQSSTGTEHVNQISVDVTIPEQFGQELLKCMQGIPQSQVN